MNEENRIDKNYNYYVANQKELDKKYKNKYIIIQEEKVVGSYKTLQEAIQEAKKLEAGTYIIQQCIKKDNTQIFHTRVRFNA